MEGVAWVSRGRGGLMGVAGETERGDCERGREIEKRGETERGERLRGREQTEREAGRQTEGGRQSVKGQTERVGETEKERGETE